MDYSYQTLTSRLQKIAVTTTVGPHASEYVYAADSDLVADIRHDKNGTVKMTESRTWDPAIDRLQRIQSDAGGIVSSHDYLYDRTHRRTKATSEDGASWSYGYSERDEITAASKTLPGGGTNPGGSAIDFSAHTILQYAGQSGGPHYVLDSGATLKLINNSWKSIAHSYNVTADTVLEFYFKSENEGEIHGIGFDTINSFNGPFGGRLFKVHGTQSWGISTYNNYDPDDGWKFYRIRVGTHFTGNFNYLVFVGDHDVSSPISDGSFKNVRVYDSKDIPGWNHQYSYDALGNRLSATGDAGDEAYSYTSINNLNQPGQITGGADYMVKGRTAAGGNPTIVVDNISQSVDKVTGTGATYFKSSVTAAATPDFPYIQVTDGPNSTTSTNSLRPAAISPAYDEDGNLKQDSRNESSY